MAGASILFGIEKAMEGFLRTICDDYGLPYDEAHARYFLPTGEDFDKAVSSEIDTSETKPMVEPKSKGKAKVSTSGSGDKVQCKALTTKKTQCKKFAVCGSKFCSCHQDYTDGDDGASSSKAKGKAKVNGKAKGKAKAKVDHDDVVSEEEIDEPDAIDKLLMESGIDTECEGSTSTPKAKGKGKAKVPAAPKKVPAKHNHPIDEDIHEDCDVCSETGNAAADDPEEYEIKKDVRSRLSAILAQVSEQDSETDDE
jgi:hypothetical protein